MANCKKITFYSLFFAAISSLTLTACASASSVSATKNGGVIDVSPKMAHYTQFNLVSQSSGAAEEQKISGVLIYKPASAYFEAHADGNTSVDRLFIQPDACRDDISPDCQRHFIISGRLTAFNTSLNCYIQVRNDTSTGYAGQSIEGICQDRNRRSFAITLFAN
ncbi:MAG: hypothetical protein WC208_03995 [Gallionella sp.]|jgi:hypothetical protein